MHRSHIKKFSRVTIAVGVQFLFCFLLLLFISFYFLLVSSFIISKLRRSAATFSCYLVPRLLFYYWPYFLSGCELQAPPNHFIFGDVTISSPSNSVYIWWFINLLIWDSLIFTSAKTNLIIFLSNTLTCDVPFELMI